jgi:hypothetical protein
MLQPNYCKLQVAIQVLQVTNCNQIVARYDQITAHWNQIGSKLQAKTKMLEANYKLQPNCYNQAPTRLLQPSYKLYPSFNLL